MSCWFRPNSLSAAIDILRSIGDNVQIVQGGTDVMVAQAARTTVDRVWLDLSGIPELQQITEREDGSLVIGAGVNLATLRENPRLCRDWPSLAASAAQTGAPAIQNRATLGGNICNASPAADNAPALLIYAAEIEIQGKNGMYKLPYQNFHQGYRQTVLQPGEIVTRIILPRPIPGSVHYFRKVGTRSAQAISKVSLAAMFRFDAHGYLDSPSFGFASVAAVPKLANSLGERLHGRSREQITLGEIRKILANDISPQSDIRSTQHYRMEIAARLVWEAIWTSPTR